MSGACQEPAATTPPPAEYEPIEQPTSTHTTEADDGWALAGGILGLSLGVTAFGLTIGSELTKENQNPAIPLGAAATILFAGSVPIAFGGAASARNQADVRGSLGAMITSWILYGLTLTDAIALIGVGASGIEPPTGLIASVGVLGLSSATLMSIHAFVAHGQARSKMEARRGPVWRPGAQPLLTFGRPTGMSFGFSGRF